jgi:hypothetical protein
MKKPGRVIASWAHRRLFFKLNACHSSIPLPPYFIHWWPLNPSIFRSQFWFLLCTNPPLWWRILPPPATLSKCMYLLVVDQAGNLPNQNEPHFITELTEPSHHLQKSQTKLMNSCILACICLSNYIASTYWKYTVNLHSNSENIDKFHVKFDEKVQFVKRQKITIPARLVSARLGSARLGSVTWLGWATSRAGARSITILQYE